jgi:hypothetical protein
MFYLKIEAESSIGNVPFGIKERTTDYIQNWTVTMATNLQKYTFLVILIPAVFREVYL